MRVSALELKQLLVSLKDHRPDICVRYRLQGEMWKNRFFRIHQITEDGAIFKDIISNKLHTIKNLIHVMQFEIETKFQNFQPHFHYSVEVEKNSYR